MTWPGWVGKMAGRLSTAGWGTERAVTPLQGEGPGTRTCGKGQGDRGDATMAHSSAQT